MCIANLYLQIMKNQMSDKIYSVKELMEGTVELPHRAPILYRWWFRYDSKILKIVCEYLNKTEVQKIKTEELGGNTYYALYFGKGVNGRRRFKNHIGSRKRTSTLRRTIAALLETTDEERITQELQQCYYEWWEYDCDKKALEGMELEWIKSGYYPLNLKDNNKISDEWKNYLQNKRKQLVSK